MDLSSIQICSLEAVREMDLSPYGGVITIEDSTIEDPFRIKNGPPQQLVLRFDDISGPHPEWIEPKEFHIKIALSLTDNIGDGVLLIRLSPTHTISLLYSQHETPSLPFSINFYTGT